MMSERVALLLVDDRPENLLALEGVLGNPELDLVKVGSGNDALRQTLKQDFALVLLDVQMPGMDGFETAELMRANPKTRHLPIIFVTAGMKDLHLQFKGYELGAVDYLIKPFEPHILQSKVKVFCDLYRQRRHLEANQRELEAKIGERVAQLRQSEERFRMLATHAPVGIVQVDRNGDCLFVNRRWCEISGLSPEQAAGQGWASVVHPDDHEAIPTLWSQAATSGGEASIDYRVRRADGKLVWVHGSAVALRDEQGEISGYLANNLDITARKRAEIREGTRSAVAGRLTAGAQLPEILDLIVASVEQEAEGVECFVLLIDTSGEPRLRPAASLRTDRPPAPGHPLADKGAICALAATQGARQAADAIGSPCAVACRSTLPATAGIACVSLPIRAMSGEVLGVLACHSARPIAADASEIEWLSEAADLAGLAIERKRIDDDLQIAASVHHSVNEAIMITDAEHRIIAVNPAFTQVTGYSPHEAIGQNPRLLKSGRHDTSFYLAFWQSLVTSGRWQGEIWNRRKNGEVYPEWLSINTIYDGNGEVLRRIAMFSDISERKRNEETISRQANYDFLTELPNRRLFLDRLQREVLKAQRGEFQVALLFVDLDHFKEVNDSLGHDAGDLLLREAARRISSCVRATDTVARLGGDEFTVIMAELADTDRVGEVAQAMLRALALPFTLGREAVYVSASVGITIFPNDAGDVETLLKNADQAMYAAKEQGRNRFRYFTASMQANAQLRLQLSNELHGAIAAGQFEVYLQPIVDLASGRICKAEALLRWRHPEHGLVGPIQFIPIAEETGLINEIGDWVFKESARVAKLWHESGEAGDGDGGPVQISVNKSPRQFFSGNTHQTWIEHLNEIGLPAACIAIEITEGLLLDDRPEIAEKLLHLRNAGVRLSLDDFGTGYSAMSYLKRFPIDFLKIDQSFVRDMATDAADQAIVEAIIVMAHKLGLKVIAEGIETAEQCELLKAAGCDYGQGYLFARPMPVAAMGPGFAAPTAPGAAASAER